jgi:hypothetical protein
MPMDKIEIGDVFQIETSKGNGYFQYVDTDDNIGELIKVFPGVFKDIPTVEELAEFSNSDLTYYVFFPLKAAASKGIVTSVARVPMPKNFKKPKFMRSKLMVKGEFLGWHIVDTDTLHRKLVTDLSKDQKQLSPWGTWNDTLLKERMEDKWTPAKWI